MVNDTWRCLDKKPPSYWRMRPTGCEKCRVRRVRKGYPERPVSSQLNTPAVIPYTSRYSREGGNLPHSMCQCQGAFLGLCAEGLVKGVNPGNYTKSIDNKRYAVEAVQILMNHPELADDPKTLWSHVIKGIVKTENAHSKNIIVVCLCCWPTRTMEKNHTNRASAKRTIIEVSGVR